MWSPPTAPCTAFCAGELQASGPQKKRAFNVSYLSCTPGPLIACLALSRELKGFSTETGEATSNGCAKRPERKTPSLCHALRFLLPRRRRRLMSCIGKPALVAGRSFYDNGRVVVLLAHLPVTSVQTLHWRFGPLTCGQSISLPFDPMDLRCYVCQSPV